MKRVISIFLAIICILSLGACKKQDQQETKKPPSPTTTEKTPKPEATENTSKDETSSIRLILDNALKENEPNAITTYDGLVRMPDQMLGNRILLQGKIVQVMEGDGFTSYRFAMDNNYDQMIYVELYPEYMTDTIVEGDYVSLYGVSAGMMSYESVIGNTISIPGVLAARMEVAQIPIPEYPTGPLTLKKYYSTGKLWSTTEIESFSIVNASVSYSNDLQIMCEVVGKVLGNNYLSLNLKCYDDEDFLLKTVSILASVSDGERFRVSDSTYIPPNTSRIELAVD